MQLKNKKRTMLALLSLMLATTGCASNNDYQDAPFDRVNEILNESDDIEDEDYLNTISLIYRTYLSNYVNYMSEEQYEKFLIFVENMNKDELYEFENTFSYLTDIFNVTDTSYGRGFYKAFTSCFLSEQVSYRGESGKELNNHVRTLYALSTIKVSFLHALFSNDINNIIDCLMESTGYDNRDELEELFLKIDLYYDLLADNSYASTSLAASYNSRIEEIIGHLIEAKRNNYPNFSDTLYANLLKESIYNDSEVYQVIPYITKRICTIKVNDGNSSYTIEGVPYEYLNDNYTFEEVKRYKVEELINKAFKSETNVSSVKDTMYLMMCLLNPAHDFSLCNSSKEIRTIMYNDLKEYFSTEDEFNTFYLRLYDASPSIYPEYLNLFIKRLEENGISYNDYLRYSALRNYLTSRMSFHIEFPNKEDYLTRDELAKKNKEDIQDIVNVTKELVLIDEDIYQPYFDYLDSFLSNNNLGYNNLYNPSVLLTWNDGIMEFTNEDESQIISASIKPKSMTYNGTNIIYYEYPEHYEDGIAIEIFTNILEQRMVREIDGFKATITDPDTDEVKTIFVIDMTNDVNTYPSIRFMSSYEDFMQRKEEGKEPRITLGGSNEDIH